jgi:hypothetical protein
MGRPGSNVSAADGADHTETAIAMLREAVRMGYSNPDAYRTELALDPLRKLLEFRLLMMDILMPIRPFAE